MKIKEYHFCAEFNSAYFEKELAVYEFWRRKSRSTERDIYPGQLDIFNCNLDYLSLNIHNIQGCK